MTDARFFLFEREDRFLLGLLVLSLGLVALAEDSVGVRAVCMPRSCMLDVACGLRG